MNRYTVQRDTAKNDVNGNPRRVFVIRDEAGTIVATEDEGYFGGAAAEAALERLGVICPVDDSYGWWRRHPDVTDLGDVDVAPGIYRRMLKWKVDR